VKKIVRWLALAAGATLAGVCATPAHVWAQSDPSPGIAAPAAPPVAHVAYAPWVQTALDSMARAARSTRTESAVCLAAYSVNGDTLTLVRFSAADYFAADSAAIYAKGPRICPEGVPPLHTHVAYDGFPRPSETDVLTERATGLWALILSVTDSSWRVIVY
jgi:hypothetical protein